MPFVSRFGLHLVAAVLAIILLPVAEARSEALNTQEARGCDLLLEEESSTFVMLEVVSGRLLVCNEARAASRFVPASTFKIANTLIALEAGLVVDPDVSLPWDGRSRGVASWDRDTSLAAAIGASTVWFFQDLTSRVGYERERAAVQRLGYGNGDIGNAGQLRSFWLSGPLEISAIEQVHFLEQLRTGNLDADAQVQARTAELLRFDDCGPDCVVHGKTGAVLPIDSDGFLRMGDETLLPQVRERTGWFVGWIDRPTQSGGPVIFAHNLDLALPGAMTGRVGVAYSILAENGVAVDE